MNVLLLMAGNSDSFREAGYAYPKNFIEIDDQPLLQTVLESLTEVTVPPNRLICLVRKDENSQYHTADVIRLLCPLAEVIEVAEPTAGAACTALLAIEQIASDQPLLIANGDQIVEAPLAHILAEFGTRRLDGGILVFEAVHPRWSYVKCDAEGLVVETAEKRPISSLATAGMYYFAEGNYFVQAAMEMIRKDAQVGGAFYICPAYNEMILRQARIGVHKIPRHAYHSLATPQGVQAYEEYLRGKKTA